MWKHDWEVTVVKRLHESIRNEGYDVVKSPLDSEGQSKGRSQGPNPGRPSPLSIERKNGERSRLKILTRYQGETSEDMVRKKNCNDRKRDRKDLVQSFRVDPGFLIATPHPTKDICRCVKCRRRREGLEVSHLGKLTTWGWHLTTPLSYWTKVFVDCTRYPTPFRSRGISLFGGRNQRGSITLFHNFAHQFCSPILFHNFTL